MTTPSRASAASAPAADPHHRITDEAGFTKVTSDARQVAAVYFYLQLDPLIDCAHHVAADFFRRPQLYTALGRQPLAPRLAELHARYGTDERIPSKAQRDVIYQAVFGRTVGGNQSAEGDFARLSADLISAAGAFAERVFDTGEEMLRERVRTSHRPLKDYLTGLAGDALEWAAADALAGIARDRAYTILRNAGVCSVFGISTPPRKEWPYVPDANADKLIEAIGQQLGTGEGPALTRESVSNRQRAALRGTEALISVLDFQEDGSNEELTSLITRCYTWGAALRSLGDASCAQPLGLGPGTSGRHDNG
ncbi:hypothetical protein O1Q96_01010 (plasmid) [Streptomyces sp. Qhu-G9]|uniref:hypothetical protein n=1 Tax=Streptomyces sp. Qhu-G9 TaxID=3452799 RepID=UPI0022AC7A5E|nr:hypothetical protein [Streptomyces aurantiacus]WAU78449.1 hypothetical protein O1Q96_01010 [Streptomyces aurantiacus]